MTTPASDHRFTDELRAACEPSWQQATEHRFIEELGQGKLEPSVYRAYLLEDHLFVGDLVSLLGSAIQEAPSITTARPLVRFAGLVTSKENDYFERAFQALEVPPAEVEQATPGATTQAFQAHLSQGARTGGFAESLAVLTAVEWVYLAWAQPLSGTSTGTWYLDEWIELHANDGFETFVGWLRERLDEEAAELSPRRRQRVAQLFTRAVELEVAFWDQAYGLAGEA